MFLILGAPRSGTTLLASTLDQNDAVIVPRETHLAIPLAFIVDRVPDQRLGKELVRDLVVNHRCFDTSLGEHLTRDEVAEAIAASEYSAPALLKAIFGRLASSVGKQVAGDKSPDDLYYFPILVSTGVIGSDIKIIHLVRDARDVVLSFTHCNWVGPDFPRLFPRPWAIHNMLLNELMRDQHDKYLFVRFEEMVLEPEATFERICRFLGTPLQQKMFDGDSRWLRYKDMPDHRNLKEGFLPDRVGAWKREMDPELRQLVESQAAEALNYFGYEV